MREAWQTVFLRPWTWVSVIVTLGQIYAVDPALAQQQNKNITGCQDCDKIRQNLPLSPVQLSGQELVNQTIRAMENKARAKGDCLLWMDQHASDFRKCIDLAYSNFNHVTLREGLNEKAAQNELNACLVAVNHMPPKCQANLDSTECLDWMNRNKLNVEVIKGALVYAQAQFIYRFDSEYAPIFRKYALDIPLSIEEKKKFLSYSKGQSQRLGYDFASALKKRAQGKKPYYQVLEKHGLAVGPLGWDMSRLDFKVLADESRPDHDQIHAAFAQVFGPTITRQLISAMNPKNPAPEAVMMGNWVLVPNQGKPSAIPAAAFLEQTRATFDVLRTEIENFSRSSKKYTSDREKWARFFSFSSETDNDREVDRSSNAMLKSYLNLRKIYGIKTDQLRPYLAGMSSANAQNQKDVQEALQKLDDMKLAIAGGIVAAGLTGGLALGAGLASGGILATTSVTGAAAASKAVGGLLIGFGLTGVMSGASTMARVKPGEEFACHYLDQLAEEGTTTLKFAPLAAGLPLVFGAAKTYVETATSLGTAATSGALFKLASNLPTISAVSGGLMASMGAASGIAEKRELNKQARQAEVEGRTIDASRLRTQGNVAATQGISNIVASVALPVLTKKLIVGKTKVAAPTSEPAPAADPVVATTVAVEPPHTPPANSGGAPADAPAPPPKPIPNTEAQNLRKNQEIDQAYQEKMTQPDPIETSVRSARRQATSNQVSDEERSRLRDITYESRDRDRARFNRPSKPTPSHLDGVLDERERATQMNRNHAGVQTRAEGGPEREAGVGQDSESRRSRSKPQRDQSRLARKDSEPGGEVDRDPKSTKAERAQARATRKANQASDNGQAEHSEAAAEDKELPQAAPHVAPQAAPQAAVAQERPSPSRTAGARSKLRNPRVKDLVGADLTKEDLLRQKKERDIKNAYANRDRARREAERPISKEEVLDWEKRIEQTRQAQAQEEAARTKTERDQAWDEHEKNNRQSVAETDHDQAPPSKLEREMPSGKTSSRDRAQRPQKDLGPDPAEQAQPGTKSTKADRAAKRRQRQEQSRIAQARRLNQEKSAWAQRQSEKARADRAKDQGKVAEDPSIKPASDLELKNELDEGKGVVAQPREPDRPSRAQRQQQARDRQSALAQEAKDQEVRDRDYPLAEKVAKEENLQARAREEEAAQKLRDIEKQRDEGAARARDFELPPGSAELAGELAAGQNVVAGPADLEFPKPSVPKQADRPGQSEPKVELPDLEQLPVDDGKVVSMGQTRTGQAIRTVVDPAQAEKVRIAREQYEAQKAAQATRAEDPAQAKGKGLIGKFKSAVARVFTAGVFTKRTLAEKIAADRKAALAEKGLDSDLPDQTGALTDADRRRNEIIAARQAQGITEAGPAPANRPLGTRTVKAPPKTGGASDDALASPPEETVPATSADGTEQTQALNVGPRTPLGSSTAEPEPHVPNGQIPMPEELKISSVVDADDHSMRSDSEWRSLFEKLKLKFNFWKNDVLGRINRGIDNENTRIKEIEAARSKIEKNLAPLEKRAAVYERMRKEKPQKFDDFLKKSQAKYDEFRLNLVKARTSQARKAQETLAARIRLRKLYIELFENRAKAKIKDDGAKKELEKILEIHKSELKRLEDSKEYYDRIVKMRIKEQEAVMNSFPRAHRVAGNPALGIKIENTGPEGSNYYYLAYIKTSPRAGQSPAIRVHYSKAAGGEFGWISEGELMQELGHKVDVSKGEVSAKTVSELVKNYKLNIYRSAEDAWENRNPKRPRGLVVTPKVPMLNETPEQRTAREEAELVKRNQRLGIDDKAQRDLTDRVNNHRSGEKKAK